MSNWIEKLDDWIPNEIQRIAPFVAPFMGAQLGITGSLIASQLGSLDDGKFDPYSAMSALIGANTQKAKARRARGRINPSQGTWGQMLSDKVSKVGLDPGEYHDAMESNWLRRGISPQFSMADWSGWSGNPDATGLSRYVEAPGISAEELADVYSKPSLANLFKPDKYGETTALMEKSADYLSADPVSLSQKKAKVDPTVAEGKDRTITTQDVVDIKTKSKKDLAEVGWIDVQQDNYGNVIAAHESDPTYYYNVSKAGPMKGFAYDTFGGNFQEADSWITNLDLDNNEEHKAIFEKYKQMVIDDKKYGTTLADSYLDAQGINDHTKWYNALNADIGEMASSMFGFWDYNPVTGEKIAGSFDAGRAIQSVTMAGTLAELENIKEELEKNKIEDEEEEGKVYREWFRSYQRTTGVPYDKSRYAEPHMLEMFDKYMKSTSHHAIGGRVGYNIGGDIMEGGIMDAPGVPPGMQLEGRGGSFVPMGIEEKADDVPAMLSKNEFVLTADAMKGLDRLMGGQGDPRAAAQHMYQMMDQLEAIA